MKEAVYKLFSHPFYLYGIIIISLITRVLYAFHIQQELLEGDAASYVQEAIYLWKGEAYLPHLPPGLPLWLAGWIGIIGNHTATYVLSMCVVWLGFTGLLYSVLSYHQVSTVYKAATLTLFAFFPTFIHHSVVPLTQLPAAVCLLALYALLIRPNASWQGYVLLGGVLGVFILTRPSSLLLLGFIPLYWFWQRRFSPKMLLIPGVVAAGIGLWQMKVATMNTQTVFINEANSLNFFYGNCPATPLYKTWWLGSHELPENEGGQKTRHIIDSLKALPIPTQDKAYQQAALRYIAQEPFDFILRTLSRIRCFFAYDTFTGSWLVKHNHPLLGKIILSIDAGLYCILVILLIMTVGKYPPSYYAIFLVLTIGYAFPYFIAFSHPTYHFPILPLIAVAIGKNAHFSSLFQGHISSSQWVIIFLFTALCVEWSIQMLGG